MRRLLLILLVTTPLAGCQYLSAGEDIEVIDPFEAANVGENAVAEAGDAIADAISEEEAFEEPTVEAGPVVTADLIPSTDPEARTRQIERARTDPFDTLVIKPAPEPVAIPVAARGNNAAANNGGGGSNSGAAAAAAAAPTPPPVRVQPDNEPLVLPSPIATLPTIPQPIVAPTVSVSGIIQLGGEPYAIVRTGSEPERYVRVGDRLADGSVRVKRIDTLAFEPQVILEENGIEVSRPINSENGGGGRNEAAPSAEPADPVATLPAGQAIGETSQAVSNQAILPGASLPASPVSQTSLQPSPGYVPDSLLLLPADVNLQATLPNMQIKQAT
ncbi:MAG: hypothetical protein AAFQ74_19745 [Cyanobacteria bacterium J06623_4]